MYKKLSIPAVAAIALASMATTGAVADPVVYTPKSLSEAIPIDLNGDGKANPADFAPGQVAKTFGNFGVEAKDMAPGQNKPKNN